MAETQGRLAENILYFARALRAAGIPVGPGAVLDALEALALPMSVRATIFIGRFMRFSSSGTNTQSCSTRHSGFSFASAAISKR